MRRHGTLCPRTRTSRLHEQVRNGAASEVTELFEQLDKLPPSHEQPSAVRDVCLGFCYGPVAALGFVQMKDRTRLSVASSSNAGSDFSLLTHQVRGVFVVFFADVFDQIVLRKQMDFGVDRPGFRVGLGIVDGDLKVHVAEVAASEALGDVQRFGGRMAGIRASPCR